jgi:hypothetical protein
MNNQIKTHKTCITTVRLLVMKLLDRAQLLINLLIAEKVDDVLPVFHQAEEDGVVLITIHGCLKGPPQNKNTQVIVRAQLQEQRVN